MRLAAKSGPRFHLDLETHFYMVRAHEDGPTPRKQEVVDAVVARLDRGTERNRVHEEGAVDVACDIMYWLEAGGSNTLLPAPFAMTRGRIRRPNEAPHYVRPLDLVKAFLAKGWVGEEERQELPLSAFDLVQ